MTKIILLVVDGGTFKIIEKGLENLPNFKELKKNGAYGVLTSTMPPITPAAWASLLSGKNPAKTGIFDFYYVKRDNIGFKLGVTTKANLKSITLYDILHEYGKKIISINVPLTYPPSTVKGDVIIPGLDTPPGRLCVHPQELEKVLKDIGYIVEPEIGYKGDGDEEIYTRYLVNVLDKRCKTLLYFLSKYDWDLIVCFLRETDLISHALWRVKDDKYVLEVYRKVDEIVGEVLQRLDKDTLLFIISDHGFTSEKYIVSLNALLLREGLIQLKKSIKTKFKKLLLSIGFEPTIGLEKMSRFSFIYKKLLNPNLKRSLHDSLFISLSDIDWTKTRAISSSSTGSYGIIYFIKNDGETRRLVMKALEKINSAIDEIFFIEDLYDVKGENMPDIMVKWKEGYVATHMFLREVIVKTTKNRRGNHDIDGIFFAYGSNIKEKYYIENAKIYDIFPTILACMDLPVPSDVDGRVLTEIFKDKPKIKRQKQSEKDRIRRVLKKIKDNL
jgi:predicted AlkP superfamily phosphohydrolase/phosphomutase